MNPNFRHELDKFGIRAKRNCSNDSISSWIFRLWDDSGKRRKLSGKLGLIRPVSCNPMAIKIHDAFWRRCRKFKFTRM